MLRPLVGTPAPDDGRTRILPVWHAADGLHPVDGGQPGWLGGAAGADAFAVVPPGWRGDGPVGLLRAGAVIRPEVPAPPGLPTLTRSVRLREAQQGEADSANPLPGPAKAPDDLDGDSDDHDP